MGSNPLAQYFRQPKIYINLPSGGAYNPPGAVQGDSTNIAVQGMTGMDEIILKTPDALFSGEASVKVIQSCCPSVKNAWELPVIDTDMLFVALRIATYGNSMTVHHQCIKCDELNEYSLDLNNVVEHFDNCRYDNTVYVDDLTIKIKPLSYRQQTTYNTQIYDLQKKVRQAQDITDQEEQQKILNALWEDLAKIQLAVNINTVDSVQTPTVNVSEREHIAEWLTNADKATISKINEKIDANRAVWAIPRFPITCTNEKCKAEDSVAIELDNSTFFA
jgi:hypothetical protein